MSRIGAALMTLLVWVSMGSTATAEAEEQQPKPPNILVLWGDDIGQSNIRTFQEFPPRQKTASFSLDQVMDVMQAGQGG